MNSYLKLSNKELKSEYNIQQKKYEDFKNKGLKLDMSRGKPAVNQLELSMDMLDIINSHMDVKTKLGTDIRNYGTLDGANEARELFAEVLGVEMENVLVGGNSSLNTMYDTVARAMSFGILGSTPWGKLEKVKFLCPVPGYDRHFAITEIFGIEMINIEMTPSGPDMDTVEKLVAADDSIKGIWCVPKYSNPTGYTYSDETVKRFAALKPAAKDFRIFWDNAYSVHDLTNTPDNLLNIFEECKKFHNEDMVYEFASTSKITFSGAGISAFAASVKNLDDIRRTLTVQTIGPDKITQVMHARYFKDALAVKAHMKKHAAIIKPKFDIVLNTLDKEISPLQIANYTRPNGGYFISLDTMDGCAKRVGELCKEAGLIITSVGATYPYGNDPHNSNIRIAPTFPPEAELKTAIMLFCVSLKLATLEKLLKII